MDEDAKKKKKRKLISNIVDGVLGALILFLMVCQVQLMISKNKNKGQVAFLFGYSYMEVLTDSMEGNLPDSLPKGTGAIVKQVDISSIKVGDILTYWTNVVVQGGSESGVDIVISHRVFETGTNSDGTRYFWTFGDNAHATNCPQTDEGCTYDAYKTKIAESDVLGIVVGHNDFLGKMLAVGISNWFVPVAVLLPITVIAVISAIDMVKESKREEAEEKAAILAAMKEAGVDPNDEKAALAFEEKERYKYEIKKEMEEEKERERKKMAKEIEQIKEEEKKRLLEEMKKDNGAKDDKMKGEK